MTADPRAPRVLLLTSGPADGADGADLRLTADIVRGLPEVKFTRFTRWPPRAGSARAGPPVAGPPPPQPTAAAGRTLPIVSWDGAPHVPERLQAALTAAVVARGTDLVHAVMTIGNGFPAYSRLRALLLGSTPVLHTVPGVLAPLLPARSRPLGTTVALSETTARSLTGAGFRDVRVVAPMVPLDRWPRLPRPAGTPVVLVTGHHDPLGGATDAVDAAGIAARAGARFRLVLALRSRPGQDPEGPAESLLARAHAAGLPDVQVRGYVDDMPSLMASAHTLLLPPTILGGRADIPYSVLQALATGRPVILTDMPQFADLGDAVLRAPPGDTLRLGLLLAWLLDQPRCWEMLAERGRRTVEERFAPDRFAAQYRDLYRELLAWD